MLHEMIGSICKTFYIASSITFYSLKSETPNLKLYSSITLDPDLLSEWNEEAKIFYSTDFYAVKNHWGNGYTETKQITYPTRSIKIPLKNKCVFLLLLLLLLFFSRAAQAAYGGSQAKDLIQAVANSLHQGHSNGIQATSATYTTAHSNARSSTLWARPGMEPATS